MNDVRITVNLPEDLVKQASALGILSDAHVEALIRADIQMQLAAMAGDPDIQRELRQIEAEFSFAEADGLDQV